MRAYYIDQQRGAGNPFGIYPAFTFGRLDAPFSGADTGAVRRPDGSIGNLTGSGINATDNNNLQTLYNMMLGRSAGSTRSSTRTGNSTCRSSR